MMSGDDSTGEEKPIFQIGQLVELHSLSHMSLNGIIGKVYSQIKERYVVKIPPPELDNGEMNLDLWRYKAIRSKNLRLLKDQGKQKKIFAAKEEAWSSAWVKRQTFESHVRSTSNKVWQKQKAWWLSTGRRSFPIIALVVCLWFFMKWYLYDSTPPWEAKPISSNKTDGYSENRYIQESPSPSTTDRGSVNNMYDHQPSSNTAGRAAECTPESFVPTDDSSTSTAETAAPCRLESVHHDSQRPSDGESFTGSASEAISRDCAPSPGTNPVEASCYVQKIHS